MGDFQEYRQLLHFIDDHLWDVRPAPDQCAQMLGVALRANVTFPAPADPPGVPGESASESTMFYPCRADQAERNDRPAGVKNREIDSILRLMMAL